MRATGSDLEKLLQERYENKVNSWKLGVNSVSLGLVCKKSGAKVNELEKRNMARKELSDMNAAIHAVCVQLAVRTFFTFYLRPRKLPMIIDPSLSHCIPQLMVGLSRFTAEFTLREMNQGDVPTLQGAVDTLQDSLKQLESLLPLDRARVLEYMVRDIVCSYNVSEHLNYTCIAFSKSQISRRPSTMIASRRSRMPVISIAVVPINNCFLIPNLLVHFLSLTVCRYRRCHSPTAEARFDRVPGHMPEGVG